MHNYKNRMTLKISSILFLCLNFGACDRPMQTNTNNERIPQEKRRPFRSKSHNRIEPPFSDSCLCSFELLGGFRSQVIGDVEFVSGKKWNPAFYSCSWQWGQFINHEVPMTGNGKKDFTIHLLDMDRLPDDYDSTFLVSEDFNNHLIATYKYSIDNGLETCQFDPKHNGKYPKPKQWVD
jgi:hypothetical protein